MANATCFSKADRCSSISLMAYCESRIIWARAASAASILVVKSRTETRVSSSILLASARVSFVGGSANTGRGICDEVEYPGWKLWWKGRSRDSVATNQYFGFQTPISVAVVKRNKLWLSFTLFVHQNTRNSEKGVLVPFDTKYYCTQEVGVNPLKAPIKFATARVRHLCLEAQEHEAEKRPLSCMFAVTVVAKLLIVM